MPDARQMSGIPLPVADVESGTVIVRLVRGSLDNPIAGQTVELQGTSVPLTAKTDEAGRATFKGLAPGTRAKAVAAVGGERLESQEFALPPSGGIRLMLVATDPDRAAEDRKLAQSPPQPGTVVLGQETRFVFEIGDEGLNVFYMLQIVNTAPAPVQPASPLALELPQAAEHPALLEGSSPQATVAGRTVTIAGPFAPGATTVQVAYQLPYSGDSLLVQQAVPARLTQLTVLAQKVGDMHLGSPQMAEHRDMTADGQTYIVGHGPALEAGGAVTFEFTGLPHEPTWPLNLAVGVAVLILIAGAWASMIRGRPAAEGAARRRKLEATRDRLFGELTALEEQHRTNRIDARRYARRRGELVVALERVYAELDEDAAA
ncbi:MAG TPA: carboxypeptidase-like regulatory domain-containing protein [Vicinamibacterales bacterium]|nr:carboxypeptidase-like regulatory domain-containing protein [Vicinamibacterales bacterium]